MASSTVENYVKTLYFIEQGRPGALVAMGELASSMQVAPGTATAMVKTLSDSGLVEYERRGGCRLTQNGRTLALAIVRRHRFIEQFLVKTLGLDWSEVHEEAEQLEHVISDKVLDRIDQLLGYPDVDPHGDPIPTAEGRVSAVPMESLQDVAPGQETVIARVTDQKPAFLQYLDAQGLVPGARITMQRIDTPADSVTVMVAENSITLGGSAVRKILVERRADKMP